MSRKEFIVAPLQDGILRTFVKYHRNFIRHVVHIYIHFHMRQHSRSPHSRMLTIKAKERRPRVEDTRVDRMKRVITRKHHNPIFSTCRWTCVYMGEREKYKSLWSLRFYDASTMCLWNLFIESAARHELTINVHVKQFPFAICILRLFYETSKCEITII